MKLTGTKTGKDYRVVTGPDGKTKVILDTKAKLSRLDLCTRLKVVKSKKQKWKPA